MGIFDVLFPPACAGCRRIGSPFCDRCIGSLRRPSREDDRFVAPDAGAVVGSDLWLATAAFAYEGPLRRALAALKYGGVRRLARPLAAAAVPSLRGLTQVTGSTVLVPIPVHGHRLRERGYNQAELLAVEVGHLAQVAVAVDCLRRVRATTKQHRLDRAERLRNLRDAFAVSGRPPRSVILVDDIITTAATLEACAAVLRASGSEEVYGFAVAREV